VLGSSQVVAVVDDDEALRQAIGSLLRSAGFPVATFGSPEEFLRSNGLETTACLILDLRMGGMGGLGLLQRLSDDRQRIPVIIVTAHDDDDASRAWCLGLGAAAFLGKPVEGDVLLAAVASALDGRRDGSIYTKR
jgi:two-component system, LuxR family, response regulator FixJ